MRIELSHENEASINSSNNYFGVETKRRLYNRKIIYKVHKKLNIMAPNWYT